MCSRVSRSNCAAVLKLPYSCLQVCNVVACSTVCKEKSSANDREELQLKTFSYHVDENAEDEVADPSLNKPGQSIRRKRLHRT